MSMQPRDEYCETHLFDRLHTGAHPVASMSTQCSLYPQNSPSVLYAPIQSPPRVLYAPPNSPVSRISQVHTRSLLRLARRTPAGRRAQDALRPPTGDRLA